MKTCNEVYGNVHSIETLGAFDGPGIRYVLFLQGCPFQCQYCHNRDTWSTKQNKLMSVSDILDDYKKYKHFYKNGGITVSGGEPLLQMNFLITLFKEAKALGIHTCLDTSAACYSVQQSNDFLTLIKYTDLILLDIKHIDNEKHMKLTGSSNTQVLAFAQYLNEMSIPVIIRHVLVPTISDSEQDLVQLRNFLETMKNIVAIEVLPYHKYGISKWKDMGLTYPLEHINEPTKDKVEYAEYILKNNFPFHK
jgi:pyruvate formate lyase activating enzyme